MAGKGDVESWDAIGEEKTVAGLVWPFMVGALSVVRRLGCSELAAELKSPKLSVLFPLLNEPHSSSSAATVPRGDGCAEALKPS